jgi:hypothetical protein
MPDFMAGKWIWRWKLWKPDVSKCEILAKLPDLEEEIEFRIRREQSMGDLPESKSEKTAFAVFGACLCRASPQLPPF